MGKGVRFDSPEAYSRLVEKQVIDHRKHQINSLPEVLIFSNQLASFLNFDPVLFSNWLGNVENGPPRVGLNTDDKKSPRPHYRLSDVLAWAEARRESRK